MKNLTKLLLGLILAAFLLHQCTNDEVQELQQVESFTIPVIDNIQSTNIGAAALIDFCDESGAISCDCSVSIGGVVDVGVTEYQYCQGRLYVKIGPEFKPNSDFYKVQGQCWTGTPIDSCVLVVGQTSSGLNVTHVRDCFAATEYLVETSGRWVEEIDGTLGIFCPLIDDPLDIPECPEYTHQTDCHFLYLGVHPVYPKLQFCEGRLLYEVFGAWIENGETIVNRRGGEFTLNLVCGG